MKNVAISAETHRQLSIRAAEHGCAIGALADVIVWNACKWPEKEFANLVLGAARRRGNTKKRGAK